LPKIQAAVDFFNQHNVDLVLHAGDYIAPFSIPIMQKLYCPFQGVFGNNDGEKQGLRQISANNIVEPPLRLCLENKEIILIHDIQKIDLEEEQAQILIFGHTHRPQIQRQAQKLLINPGECCGWLTQRSSVAILDLSDLSAKLFDI